MTDDDEMVQTKLKSILAWVRVACSNQGSIYCNLGTEFHGRVHFEHEYQDDSASGMRDEAHTQLLPLRITTANMWSLI